MAKQLNLRFLNESGKIVTISVNDPVEPVDGTAASQAMDTILAQNAFVSSGGKLVSKKDARLVEHNITDVTLA